jgi:hypothetical protein
MKHPSAVGGGHGQNHTVSLLQSGQIDGIGQCCGVYRVPVCGELLGQVLLAPISANQTKVKFSFHTNSP